MRTLLSSAAAFHRHVYIHTHTHTHVGHTFEISGEFSGEVRQGSEVEDPQVLPFAAHSVRGGREASPRAGVPANDNHTCTHTHTYTYQKGGHFIR